MSAPSRLSICSTTEVLTVCFAVYGVLSLFSMALMGIGAFVLLIAILVATFLGSLRPDLTRNLEGYPADIITPRGLIFRTFFRSNPANLGYLTVSLVLALSCAASLIGASYFPLGYGGKFVEVHFLKDMAKAWYFFWPCVLVIGLRQLNFKQQTRILNVWLIAFGVFSCLGILQYFKGWPRPQPIPGEPGRFHTTLFLGHHLSVASIYIFPFFVSLDWLLARVRELKAPFKFWQLETLRLTGGVLGVTLGFCALMLTYSRTLWVALPLGIILWMVLSLPRKFKIYSLIACLLCLLGMSQIPQIQRRLHDGIGIATRQDLWTAHYDFLKSRPFTGVGWHHNQELSGYYLMNKFQSKDVFSGHAHNNLLDVLGGLGVFGGISWIVWCGFVIALLIKSSQFSPTLSPALGPVLERKTEFSRGLICAWFVFHINGLTQVNFWEAKVEHQLAWVIAWSLLCFEYRPPQELSFPISSMLET